MTIPTASNFPDEFDDDTNLYLVHDALRLRLSEDYTPGDTSITISGDSAILDKFPADGLITLTEQCSDIDERAISFHYSAVNKTTGVFSGLEILPGFTDVPKLKRITNVTQNVMAECHNNSKDAVIAIENWIGKKGTTDVEPLGETLEGRTNFLRRLVLQPKAWFKVNRSVGVVPLEVTFTEQCFRLGTDGTAGPVIITWDFGDNTSSSVTLVSATSRVPDGTVDAIIYDEDRGEITKVYHEPGVFDVIMTVRNDFGEDIFEVRELIKARTAAPDTAIIRFVPNTQTQSAIPGDPVNGPFTTFPSIRSPINTIIQIEIPDGENSATPGISYAGETLNESDTPIDPITNYTWSLGDDLLHPNASHTDALYSVGGIYNLKLRVDTEFGAYRITTYDDAIDIIENTNLWLWTFNDSSTARSYEYGLISETFKTGVVDTLTVTRDDSFLDDVPESERQKREFAKNTFFAPRGASSGRQGQTLLGWATGREASDAVSTENIKIVEFNAFSGIYVESAAIARPWNWTALNNTSSLFFVFGKTTAAVAPDVSPVNRTKTTGSLTSLTLVNTTLLQAGMLNGADELFQNTAVYDSDGDSVYGHFSVYRTAWKDSTGYIVRNGGVGPFFRLNNFYCTVGQVGDPFQGVRKLNDVQGPTKTEGQLTAMSSGIYFFNNSGSISRYDDTTDVWRVGGPGVNSVAYRAFQDTDVPTFNDSDNTLLLASDGDHRAYLSFDYSPNVFMKYNEIDTTFTSLGSRPEGNQFIMGVY